MGFAEFKQGPGASSESSAHGRVGLARETYRNAAPRARGTPYRFRPPPSEANWLWVIHHVPINRTGPRDDWTRASGLETLAMQAGRPGCWLRTPAPADAPTNCQPTSRCTVHVHVHVLQSRPTIKRTGPNADTASLSLQPRLSVISYLELEPQERR